MPNPFVSIIVPSRRTTLRTQTLASLDAQTDKDFEVLMIHAPEFSLGMDGCAEVADKLNRMASIAEGHYLLILPDDDLLSPWSVAEYKVWAQRNLLPDVVFGPKQRIDALGRYIDRWECGEWTAEDFARRNVVEGWTALVKNECWEAAGGADPGQIFQDWAFFRACQAMGATAFKLPVALWQNRLHADTVRSIAPDFEQDGYRLLGVKP